VDAEARRSEDQPACAHLRVLYTTEQIEGGRTRGWWACDSCRAKFTPVASAEHAVAQAVKFWQDNDVARIEEIARLRGELAILKRAIMPISPLQPGDQA
jgi:hypothetical protein